jgi:hypothetical protein
MCCFSRHVDLVSNTNIFARSSQRGGQFIVYSMQIQTKEDLAMILPIPVPPGSPDDAVKFINLKGYKNFFDELAKGFPKSRGPAHGSDSKTLSASPKLPVIDVGDFGASFVPSIKDFSRLDERFRLPETAWEKLPGYRNYGFAVFKLKEGEAKKQQKVHPMAFEFPRANPKMLFFPTVHIHDGIVRPEAEFDHTLYCQTTGGEKLPMMDWDESPQLAAQFIKADKTQGIVDGESHVYVRSILGMQKNEDIVV